MSELTLINSQDAEHAKNILARFYENEMIPAEKKAYLTDLKHSQGAWLGIEGHDGKPHHFMDAASQIATLGLGFNSSVFHGTAHLLSSWTNNPEGEEFKGLHIAFRKFIKRKLGWNNAYLTYCHSGAEANETALGFCYKNRVNKKANKVLAFEGSFHGRMLVSLASTWNPIKREPFEWKGYETVYCKGPSDPEGKINRDAPSDWANVWDQATKKEFHTPEGWKQDKLLMTEVESLLEVREKLLTGTIFAVIIEPMQCEGGDLYLTGRFHSALILLARSFGVKIIHDEVQTGFHLGREFFWHKQLKLKGLNNQEITPDYVVCAKKAQVGMVISHERTNKEMEFNISSAVRGYLHAVSLDQSQGKIIELEKITNEKLKKLVNNFSEYIENPRINGLAFSFDFKNKDQVNEFINDRFDFGLLYYPAGDCTLRFRLNLGFKAKDVNFLFDQLTKLGDKIFLGKTVTPPTSFNSDPHLGEDVYEWQEHMIQSKLKGLHGEESSELEWSFLTNLFKEKYECDLIRVDRSNFERLSDKIVELQQRVYEPARQTKLETFKKNAEYKGSVCLALVRNDELLGMAFSAPLKANPLERGVRQDPWYENENVLYMIDTTISPDFQGRGQGRFLKYALQIIATAEGHIRIHGRNRDRLAAGMLFINLSMGAYEQLYLREDYPDFEKYRDVIYYTSPLQWRSEKLNMTSALNSPLGETGLTQDMILEELPYLNNKVCLSNFVSERFMEQTKDIFNLMPVELRHGFTASGQSECVDKVAKTLWWNDKKKSGYRMVTFDGHFFGTGSFLARSLSDKNDPFFPVTHLENPNTQNNDSVLKDVEVELQKGDVLGVWIEPIQQQSMQKTSPDFLMKLRELCTKHEVNLVFNETLSGFYRYHPEHFFASGMKEIMPDAVMNYMGGQSGMVFTRKDKFLEKPLMMISTWDGDEFSLSKYHNAAMRASKHREATLNLYENMKTKLHSMLEGHQLQEFTIENGVGYFTGNFPESLTRHFKRIENKFLVAPNIDDLSKFMERGLN